MRMVQRGERAVNINRLRPIGVARENLDLWLSGVIYDAIRDAQEAGLPQSEVYALLRTITAQEHPLGSKEGFRAQDQNKKP
jgi:hypothetical protein